MGEKNNILKKEILKELYFNKSLSVSPLSLCLDRSIPVTQKIINELIEENLVADLGFAPSTGGRRALVYALQPGHQYVIAVAMDQLITKISLIDIESNSINKVELIELPLEDNSKSLEVLIEILVRFIKTSDTKKNNIIGIGIGMPGFIDTNKGLNYSFLPTVNSRSICDIISEVTKLPVYIDNDSSLIALSEQKFGIAKNKRNALVINISWGIGLGLILDGSLFRGDNGFAGEFSHIPLFSNNKLCSCGKTGCLETETSLLAIVLKAKQELTNGRTSILQNQILGVEVEKSFELIAKAAMHGDRLAIELISKAAYDIGRGVSILIHILNPEIIVLSGRGSLAGKVWLAPIQQAINEYTIPRLAAHTKIEVSEIAEHAELIGAAALVMKNYEKFEITQTKQSAAYQN